MLKELHKKSSCNIEEIIASKQCGCFHCVSVKNSKDITRFIGTPPTGFCPDCHIDSLLPNVTDLKLLSDMQNYYFSETMSEAADKCDEMYGDALSKLAD